jgi:PKD repeat protein
MNNPAQCLNGNVFSFTNFSSISSGSLSQLWQFGDGGGSTFSNPNYIYSSDGSYNVMLKVTSNLGCKDSIMQGVVVYASPKANLVLSDTTACVNDAVLLINQTQLNNGTYTHQFDLGEGTLMTTTNDTIGWTYPLAGNYVVGLLAVSDHQCRDSVYKLLEVNSRPATPVIVGDTVVNKHSSVTYQVATNAGSSYLWMITGDSAHAANANQILVHWGPSDGGSVRVSEIAANGCASDTANMTVRVALKSGLNHVTEWTPIRVYPQPAGDVLYLSGETQRLESAQLISVEGKILHTFSTDELQAHALSLNAIPSGMYLLLLRDGENKMYYLKLSVSK